MTQHNAPHLETMREPLRETHGKRYWRSLQELADTEEFRQLLDREFPEHTVEGGTGTSRRRFLQLIGASLALAGLQGCTRRPEEKIVPYVRQPEDIVPGKPLYFATAAQLGGIATGLLVESHVGRPTKVEGNPDHPGSLGATDVFAQAEVLALYDPGRSQTVLNGGEISTWNALLTSLKEQLDLQRPKQGAGLRILTETLTSPTLADQLQAVLEAFPKARWHQYEPVHRGNARRGAELAFGKTVNPLYRFERADVVLSLDADFLTNGPGHVRHAREFMRRRRTGSDSSQAPALNRLYVVESTPTPTGGVADHCLPLRASQIEAFTGALAAQLGVEVEPPSEGLPQGVAPEWLNALVDDLKHYRVPDGAGGSLVVAGDAQPPRVHALAHAMNQALGNVGKSVVYTEPVEASPVEELDSLRTLVHAMNGGEVEVLLMLGGNPVFSAPGDLRFAEALREVPYRLHLALYEDETSALCHWHVPETHFLESWSDARAYDGTVTIIQPLIAPLYNNRSAHELLGAVLDKPGLTAHQAVQNYWKQRTSDDKFEEFWQTALHDGVVPGTAAAIVDVSLQEGFAKSDASAPPFSADTPNSSTASEHHFELVFRPDPTIWDGRYANNGWLQELPKPLTKLTWDNAALVSPATAQRLGLSNEDVVSLRRGERTLELPIWIVAGQPDDSVTVHFGYGRTRAGQVGSGPGFDAYVLRSSDAPWFATDALLRKTGRKYALAATDLHHLMNGRHLVRAGTAGEVRDDAEHPAFMEGAHKPSPQDSLYPGFAYDGYKWGMSINLQTCIGCNACVVACQAENNIPVVGKEEVVRGREMHWLRIDAYREGEPENPRTYFEPVPCMQCENAPCEVVCPVAATVHSDEGINQMVYNRCVGTRYCSNNCPYKVRRFNFLQFSDYTTPVLKLLRNPDVTVRSRGVMEKCTYCVQRINAARIEAEEGDRRIRDGDVVTACQQVCPTEAIVFGDMNDPKSRLKQLKDEPLDFALLAELNTRPRTTYLAAVRNPNPKLANA